MSLALNHAKEIGKKEAMDFLKSHKRFLLVGHEHPDGDDVGCAAQCPRIHGEGGGHAASRSGAEGVHAREGLRARSYIDPGRKGLRCDRFHGSFQSGTRRKF